MVTDRHSEALTGVFHDAATGETIIRELTAEEIAVIPDETETQNVAELLSQKQEARESAIAKLSAIGLTQNEINALLGSL